MISDSSEVITMSSIWGKRIKLSVFGESHGAAIGGVLDGLPAGIEVNTDFLAEWMKRRTARSFFGTSRRETDSFKILSGVYCGKTTGSPVSVIIENQKASGNEKDYLTARPSHSDYVAYVKNGGYNDIRGGGHYSARLTASLTFFGGLLAHFLEKEYGVSIGSHVLSVSDIRDRFFNPTGEDSRVFDTLRKKEFPVISENAEQAMLGKILEIKESGDTIGGEIECIVSGLPVGLGDPVFDGLDSALASVLFSIPSVKSLEFGVSEAWKRPASEVNDNFAENNGEITFATNNSGGLLGGITSGMPLLFRVGMKPVPSSGRLQSGVNLKTGEITEFRSKTLSDSCQLPRSCVIIESAATLAIADAFVFPSFIKAET